MALTVEGGTQGVDIGHNERGVFIHFHSGHSWHMSTLEARLLGATLTMEALDAPDGVLDAMPAPEVPSDG